MKPSARSSVAGLRRTRSLHGAATVRTEIVTITVMMIEWVNTEELMIAAAIAVTTGEALSGPWRRAPEVGDLPPGTGAERSPRIAPGRSGSVSAPQLPGWIWSGSTGSAPFTYGDEVFAI